MFLHVYREEYKGKKLMVSNFDPTIKSNSVSAASTTSTTVSTGENKSSGGNTVFSEQLKKSAKLLGITPEEYQALMNDPNLNFASLTPEEQLKFIQEYKSTQSGEGIQTEQQTVNPEPEAQPAQEAAVTTDIQESSEFQETSETEDVKETVNNKKVTPEDLSAEDGYDFDTASYTKLKPGKMFDLYVKEYAKNKFLFADPNNAKSIEEWNNLPEQERKELLKTAKAQAKRELRLSRNILNKNSTGVGDGNRTSLEMKMILLQTANAKGESVEKIKRLSTNEQAIMIADTLRSKNQFDPSKLSKIEQQMLAEANLNLESVRAALYKQGDKNEIAKNLCFDNIQRFVLSKENPKGVKLAQVQKEYLETKQKNGEKLTEFETRRLESLNKISAEDMENFGSKIGTDTELTTEILQDKKLSEKYAKADTIEKAAIKAKFALSKYKDDPEKFQELIQNAIACGNLEEVLALHSLAKNHVKIQENLANTDDNDIQNVNSHNIQNLGESASIVAEKNLELEKTDTKRAERFQKASLVSCEDSQMPAISAATSKSKIESVQIATVDRGFEIEDVETGKAVAENVKANSSKKAISYMGQNADKAKGELQYHYLNIAARDDAEVTNDIINNGTVERLNSEYQTRAFNNLKDNAETLMPKDKAINALNKLSDSIEKCDKSNQLDMHESITSSKYSEVQEHAASNIYKYHESVQAKAIEVTRASGNSEAIDRAMANFDKYSDSVKQNPEYQKMQQETEVRKADEVARQVAEFHVQYQKLTGQAINLDGTQTDKERQIEFIKKFLGGTPQEQFKMITNMPHSMQGSAFAKIAMYCPQMLTNLVKGGYGKDILSSSGLSSELAGRVINIMLTCQDSDKKEAVKFVKKHKSMFNEATLERVENVANMNSSNTVHLSSKSTVLYKA